MPPSALSCPCLPRAGARRAAEGARRRRRRRRGRARRRLGRSSKPGAIALTLLPAGVLAVPLDRRARAGAEPEPDAIRRRAAAAEPAASDAKKAWSGGAIAAAALLIWKFKAIGVFLLDQGQAAAVRPQQGRRRSSRCWPSLGVYWTIWGWKFALGFVLSIYIHEMGHVAAMKRYGLPATAPMFIPGLRRVHPHEAAPGDGAARRRAIGLAGPIWGFGAAAALLPDLPRDRAARSGRRSTHVGAMINLFNLMPIWQLDGGHALQGARTAPSAGSRPA